MEGSEPAAGPFSAAGLGFSFAAKSWDTWMYEDILSRPTALEMSKDEMSSLIKERAPLP